MKCTSNFKRKCRLLCITCIAAIFMTGCGSATELSNQYNAYSSDYLSGSSNSKFFSDSLCVTDDINFGQESTQYSKVAEGAGVFNLDKKEVMYNQNIFEKLYPASTTKILTAYIIIKNSNLDDVVTVSENAANPGESSSVCGLNTGDQITVNDLLYGLMLDSGTDAAIALAEYYSGSVEEFANVMNEEAKKLGASKSNFVNPSGYPDDNHYTTIYDMYLIIAQAVNLDKFTEIIHSSEYTANYKNSNGEIVQKEWKNTCKYIAGTADIPSGFDVVGGKTGTTNAAGYCLVLYSLNENKERIVSIVYKADGRSNMYLYMSEILSTFGK